MKRPNERKLIKADFRKKTAEDCLYLAKRLGNSKLIKKYGKYLDRVRKVWIKWNIKDLR